MSVHLRPSRRRFLGGALGAGGLLVTARASAATAAASAPGLDLTNPKAALDAYIKLRGSTAPETTYVQYDGDIFAARSDGDSIPLVGFRGVAKSHWRPDGQGGYINMDYDLGVFVDHRTGALLKTWLNPITGRRVEVTHFISGPSGGHFKPGVAADDPYGSGRGRWGRIGDHLWQTNATVLSWPNILSPKLHPLAWSGETIYSSMSTTYSGRLSDVTNPALAKVSSILVWTDILSPNPWMQMGQRDLMCEWRMMGAKAVDVGELDPALVAELEAVFPGYISTDAVWTRNSGGWSQYLDRFPRGESR